MNKLEDHPLASLFPILPPADMRQLEASIKSHGLQHSIVLLEGKILDGRHRYEACNSASVKPHFTTYKGKDPLGFVLSANLHRRHLDTAQRAMIAARLSTMRQGARTDLELSANLHEVSLGKAAEDVDVSRRSAATAKKIIEESPRLAKEVDTGKLSLHGAVQQIKANAAIIDVSRNKEPKKEPEIIYDSIGFSIPSKLIDLWKRGHSEIPPLMSAIRKIQLKVTAHRKANDILFRRAGFQDLRVELHKALTDLNLLVLPFCVCPACQGRDISKCLLCKDVRFIPKHVWKSSVSKEDKEIRAKMAKASRKAPTI